MPVHAAEHRACRERVALFDQSAFGKLALSGPDASRFLQRVCANNIDVTPCRTVYTPMLNQNGGYEADVTLIRMGTDEFVLVTGSSQTVRDAHWLRRQRLP